MKIIILKSFIINHLAEIINHQSLILNRKASIINRIFALLIIVLMLFESFIPSTAYAQTPTVSPSTPPAPSLENIAPPANPIIDSLSDKSSQVSAAFRSRTIIVARLAKSSYQAKEKIEMVVKNVTAQSDLKLEIENAQHSEIRPHIDEKFINGEVVFSINPEVGMKPGKYTVRIIDNSNNQVLSEQDFTWGVLAINTHKSIYLPGETAKIAMAVLDEQGNMVCDAQVKLEITAPWGQKTLLSTSEGTVTVNRECLLHEVTERPDYEASYITSDIGRYFMTLTATKPSGSFTVKDRFEVRETVPYDIERLTATRIYPPETYPVTIKIKANEAFHGKIVESVPQDFQILPGRQGTISYSEESIIPESYDPKTETNIPDLRLPFNGNYPLTQGFGEQIDDPEHKDAYKKSGLDGHDGLDFALPSGTPVVAVDGGKVILAQEKWIYGTTVVIEHTWGRSYYGHFSKLSVEKGENVAAGQEIGLSGSTGLSTGPHLHFGLKPKNNDIDNLYFGKIDPAPFFGLADPDPTLSTADYPIAAKALVWNLNIEKGAEFTIGYQYNAPFKSPYFYTIGPLQFITTDLKESDQAKFDVPRSTSSGQAGLAGSGSLVLGETDDSTTSAELGSEQPQNIEEKANQKEEVVFSEIREWQIAADATNTIVLDSNADGTCGSGCLTIPANWTDVNTIHVIGGGGAGDNTSATAGEGGGGGGAWARKINADLTGGNNVNFNVGAGGTDGVQPGNTWFCNNTTSCASLNDTNVIVSADGGTTATGIGGGAGGDLTGLGPDGEFAGGAGGTGDVTGADSAGGGGGAGSPNGTGGTGGAGDSVTAGEESSGGGGGSGCDSIGSANDGTIGGADGGNGGNSCFATGGTGVDAANGNPGTNGSGGGGADEGGQSGGRGGDGIQSFDPSFAGGGGGGGDDDAGTGGNGGGFGGGGGGGQTVGNGSGGVIVITYTIVGPSLENTMRHGNWFNNGAEQEFSF